jgi:hypothetical protein
MLQVVYEWIRFASQRSLHLALNNAGNFRVKLVLEVHKRCEDDQLGHGIIASHYRML